LKVLKALARHNNTDFDADYKLPKILRNYKGNEVDKLNVPVYTSVGRPVPQTESSRNSFRYLRASDVGNGLSTASKLFGDVKTSDVSGKSSGTPPRPSSDISRPSFFTVNSEWNKKWKTAIGTGRNVVHTSVITKRNQFGMNKTRQLILTDQPSLVYVETGSMSVKGEVVWDKESPPVASVVRHPSTFLPFIRLMTSLFLL
jgi:hypothetical protein